MSHAIDSTKFYYIITLPCIHENFCQINGTIETFVMHEATAPACGEIPLSELFAQQVHISRLRNKLENYVLLDRQLELLNQLRLSGAPPTYQQRILSHVIGCISSAAKEPAEELSEMHAQLIVKNMQLTKRINETRVIYRFDGNKVEINEERYTLAKNGGTGYRTWEASLALADYFIKNPLAVTQVIELGAGTGFLSQVLIQLGCKVLATDGDPHVLAGIDDSVPTKLFYWETQETELMREMRQRFQNSIYVAADVLYDPNNYAPFLSTLKYLLTLENYAIVATTMRQESTYDKLLPMAAENGLVVEKIARYDSNSPSQYFYIPPEECIEIVRLTVQRNS